MRDGMPIAFESQKLNESEKRMSTYNKEMLAVIHVIEKWRQYLLESKFVVKTYHSSLKYLLQQEMLTDEQRKWIDKIQAFEFEISYKKGKENVIIDVLLQRDENHSCYIMTIAQLTWIS
eukprot:Gb_03987 [translate_table: standard]